MSKSSYGEHLLGEIVAEDFRTAAIFKSVGIDFCCGGKKTLQEACDEKALDIEYLSLKFKTLEESSINSAFRYNEWNLDFLADFIVNTHHRFVLKSLPDLMFYTEKIARVHGDHHPELIEVADLFSKINAELLQHLQKEEEVLFPAIKEALKTGSKLAKATIKSEIERMSAEHEFAGGAMDQINLLTNAYAVPEDGCSSYTVCLKLLEQFEDDLHIHVHLENNILYPKALTI